MSEKDTIKDLFSDKLNGLESKVRPELWGNISSQLGGASVASGMSVLTKIVLGVTAAASVAVVAYFVLNGQEETQKPTTSAEKQPISKDVKENNISEENQQTAQQQGPILPLDFSQEIILEENSPISFDPETPQRYPEPLETVVVEAEQETQQHIQSSVPEQTQIATETIEEEALVVGSSSLEITLPNTFTPNGDGVNEKLQLNISEDKLTPGTFSFVVIDRTGKTVYQTTDVHFEWEGVSMNGEVVPAGDYVYYVTARDTEGKLITKYSTLHIVR
jgi:gliding motility-associated-like protein